MKKSKLIMSIITCCFALSVLAFGVYASLSVNFNLSGKISFDLHGVDATIETQVFKYKEGIDQEQAYLKASELQVEDFDTHVSKGYENLTTKQTYLTKEGNTYYPNLEQDLSDSVLNFEDCEAYFIVVHVLPSDSYDLTEHNQIVFVELTQQDLPEENVWLAYNDKYLAIYPSAQDSGFNMVFFIGITEPYKQVDEYNFSLTLSFEYKDIYVPTEDDYGSDIEFYPGQAIEDIVLPEKCNDNFLLYAYDEGGYLSGKVIMPKYFESYDRDYGNILFEAIVTQDNEHLSSLDGSLYNKSKSILYNYEYDGETKIVNIHNFVEEIGDYAFFENNIITTVNLSDATLHINVGAFQDCDSLKKISISENLINIKGEAFSSCDNLIYNIDDVYGGKYLGNEKNKFVALIDIDKTKTYNTKFVLNEKCKVLGGVACMQSNITTFDFNGADIKEIPNDMFNSCSSLTSITIPESVTSIGRDAFSGCNDSIFTIDTTYGGKYLKSESNPYFALVGMDDTKATTTNFILNKDCKVLGEGACSRSAITSFNFNDVDVKEIPADMFRNCSSLIDITIPDSITSIGEAVFNGCSSLTDITIPESITSIGEDAFGGTSLSSIYIPKSVQKMDMAFWGLHNANFKIYCEIEEENKPVDWVVRWNESYFAGIGGSFNISVTWGVTREDYLKAIGE